MYYVEMGICTSRKIWGEIGSPPSGIERVKGFVVLKSVEVGRVVDSFF